MTQDFLDSYRGTQWQEKKNKILPQDNYTPYHLLHRMLMGKEKLLECHTNPNAYCEPEVL